MPSRTRAASIASSVALALLAVAPAASSAHIAHTVQPGESLSSIATAYGVGISQLAADNGLASDSWLLIGSTVMVPEESQPAAPAEPAPVPSVPAGAGECIWECDSPDHPHPTNETVTGEQVGAIASAHGMSASLVQSIAWVESGFDNSRVSSADARGVMQIIPETWSFIEQRLAERPLDPQSALANVEAGTLYLHHLYHLKGGDPEHTVGSYHQGPNRDSLLPETEGYVEQVRARQAALGG